MTWLASQDFLVAEYRATLASVLLTLSLSREFQLLGECSGMSHLNSENARTGLLVLDLAAIWVG